MQFSSTVVALVLAACAAQAAPGPAAVPSPFCGSTKHPVPCYSKREDAFTTVAKRHAEAAAEAFCGWTHHGVPCYSKRSAEFLEATLIAKREAETSPEALAAAYCGATGKCNEKRAAEAIAEAHAEAEANPQPLPSPEAFAEAFCGWTHHGVPCYSKRVAEAVPEAFCGWKKRPMPCYSKRDAILRREYSALLALQKL